jgi:hypothetical protein
MALIASRGRLFAVFLALAILVTGALSPAAVELSTGIRYVIPTGTMDDCGTKAKTALDAYLQGATESSPGEWIATGPVIQLGRPDTTAAATAHCYPNGSGYVVTFSCTVETPNNPYDAASLCLDVARNFSGGAQTALATPTPIPTGCTTANLAGTWQSDKDSKLSLKIDINGELTDSEDVIGNWILSGNKALITYYGNHNMTLSADGKHLTGGGYSFTRQC